MAFPDFDQAEKWIAGALAAVAGAWALRRRISGDTLAVKKDQAEGNYIQQLQARHDELVQRDRQNQEERRKDAEMISTLKMRADFAQERAERMERELRHIKRLLVAVRPELAQLLDSDFGALPDKG